MNLARTLAAAALVFVLAPVATASAVDHSRGTPGYCGDANGVTVVIDFQDLGGDVLIRCAPGGQASGLTALQNAGIEVTGVQRWGLGFVCRVEGRPGPEAEACIDTPPTSAYWSYWHAPNGGDWTYSQFGVMNRKPPPGSFEGWSFSKNRTADTTPRPRVGPVRPGQAVEPPPPQDVQNGGIPGRDGVPEAPQPENAPPVEQVPAGVPPAETTAPPAPSEVVAAPLPSSPPSSETLPVGGFAAGGVAWTGGESLPSAGNTGFPWGAALGGAAVLLLGGAAGLTAWRRKRASA